MTRSTLLRSLLLGLLLATAFAAVAAACPSCIDVRTAKARWFSITTVYLTLLPLVGIGAVVAWVRHQVVLARRDDASAGDPPEPSA